jgi:hypothetical protein
VDAGVDERPALRACLETYRAWGLAEREIVAALETALARTPR